MARLSPIGLTLGTRRGGGGTPAPAPSAPTDFLDNAVLQPAFRISTLRRKTSDAGAHMRVRGTGGTTYDVSSAAEADAAGATKLVALYDFVGAQWITFGTELDYFKTSDGIVGGRNPSTSLTVTTNLPAATANLFKNLNGHAVNMVMGNLPDTNVADRKLWFIPVNGSTTAARYLMQLNNATKLLQFGGRRLDADSAVTASAGTMLYGRNAQTIECFGMNIDHVAQTCKALRTGSVWETISPYLTSGASSNTNPGTGSRFEIPPGAEFYDLMAWTDKLGATDEAALLADHTNTFGMNLALNDAVQSWWTNSAVSNGTRISAGFTTVSGHAGVAEFEEATGKLLKTKILTEPGGAVVTYPQDDHIAVAPFYTASGKLIVAVTGHGDALGGGNDATYRVYVSSTGRVADLGTAQILTTTQVRSNYLQIFEIAGSLLILCNDDTTTAWLAFRSTDDGATWTESRRFGTSTAGQLYCWGVKHPTDSNKLLLFWSKHNSVANGSVWVSTLDIPTGVMTSGGGTGPFALNAWDTSTSNAIANVTSYSAVIGPVGASKALRVHDVSPQGHIAYSVFDSGTWGNAEQFAAMYTGSDRFASGSYTARTLGLSGAAFYVNGTSTAYHHDVRFAREKVGTRIYRTRTDGTNEYAERLDTTDAFATYSTTSVDAASATAGKEKTRFHPINGVTSGAGRLVAFADQGLYTSYVSWLSHKFRVLEAA